MHNSGKKRVLIAGASSDLGQVICRDLLAHNYTIIGHYNRKIPDQLTDDPRIDWKQADFNDPSSIDEFLRFLRLEKDVPLNLVFCPGLIERKSVFSITANEAKSIYNVNVISFLLLIQALAEKMKVAKFGRIVALSSIGVKFAGSESSAVYSSSKLALEGLVRSFSKNLAQYNILANSIRVGVIKTKIHSGLKTNLSKREAMIPIGKAGEPEDIASMVTYLLSDLAKYITGQDFAVSGGE